MEKILTISGRRVVNPRTSDLREGLRSVYRNVALLDTIDLNYYYDVDRYKIKDDKKFDAFLTKMSSEGISPLKQFLCKYYGDKNAFYSLRDSDFTETTPEDIVRSVSTSSGEIPFIFFGGEKIEFNIIPSNTKPDDLTEFKLHPKIKNYVKEHFEARLYSASVRASEIRYQNLIRDTRELIEQD